jgi:heterotetrameric sarcosine oxidase delta subunit
MLQIDCPNCGPRAQVEFAYERTLDSIVHLAVSPAEAMATLYRRANPRGWSDELWHHRFGCRRWLVVRRNTATHEIASVAEVAS